MTTINSAAAAQILQTASSKSELLDNKLSQGASKAELGAKEKAIAITKDQIDGEKKSAVSKAGFSIGGSAANMKASMRGEQLMARGMQMDLSKMTKASMAKREADMAKGGAMRNIAQNGGVANMVTSLGDLTDKTIGGTHQADAAKIAGKLNDVQITAAGNNKQTAQAAKTASQAFFDKALEFTQSLATTAKSTLDKITG